MPYQDFFAEIDNHVKLHDTGTVTIAEDIQYSVRRRVKQITHYILSRYDDGRPDNKDAINRRRPFQNIGNAIVDLEWRAKNIDRASIQYDSVDGDIGWALIVNRELQQYMQDEDFGRFIDNHQRKKSEYGNVMLKRHFDEDGDLEIEVCQWTNLAINPRNIKKGVKLEKHELSPMELRRRSNIWDSEEIERVIEDHKKLRSEGRDIEIWDIEGEFPKYFFNDIEDKSQTALYMVKLAVLNEKKYLLHQEEIKESNFKFFKRKAIEGIDWGLGVWEEIIEDQIWTNDAIISQKFAMDLAGKVVIKTNIDSNIPSASSLLDGEIISMEDGQFFEPVNLSSSALPLWGEVMDRWFLNMQRGQSAFGSMTGEGADKAGVPFAAQALQASQAGSIFNKRRDDDGYDLAEVIIDWVMPYLVKKINREHKLTASYSPKELRWIDEIIKTEKHNQAVKDMLGGGPLYTPEDQANLLSETDQWLQKHGSTRTIEIPKGFFTLEKIKTKGRFNITNEQQDGQRKLNALATQLQSMAPTDPLRQDIIKAMMEVQGISPASFFEVGQAATPQTGATPTVPKPNQTIQNALPEGQR